MRILTLSLLAALVFSAPPLPPPEATSAAPPAVASPPAPIIDDPPVSPPSDEPTLPPTAVTASVTDLCSPYVQSCAEVVKTGDLVAVMKCVKDLFPGLGSSVATASCQLQMKGSIALTCYEDFTQHCEQGHSFEALKNCAEHKIEEFSPACEIAIGNFEDKMKSARYLHSKRSKHHSKHSKHHSKHSKHHSKHHKNRHHKNDESAEITELSDVQWLWGGEILSDLGSGCGRHGRWGSVWHRYGVWVTLGVGLVFLLLMIRCCIRRRKRRQAARELEGNGSVNSSRSRRCFGRWSPCARLSHRPSAPESVDNETEMPSSTVSYVALPVAQQAPQLPTAQVVNGQLNNAVYPQVVTSSGGSTVPVTTA